MTTLTEADVEHAALEWLSGLNWRVAHGPDIAPDIAPDTPNPQCFDYSHVILEQWLRDPQFKTRNARDIHR